MKILLDTHTFIWATTGDARLPSSSLALLADTGNELLLSAISVYEMAIKVRIRKLDLKRPLPDFVREGMRRSGLTELPIRIRHSIAALGLPDHHKDPFDRLLIATAIDENVALMTVDDDIRKYPVRIAW